MLLTSPGYNAKKIPVLNVHEREQPLIHKMYVNVLLQVKRERQSRMRVI